MFYLTVMVGAEKKGTSPLLVAICRNLLIKSFALVACTPGIRKVLKQTSLLICEYVHPACDSIYGCSLLSAAVLLHIGTKVGDDYHAPDTFLVDGEKVEFATVVFMSNFLTYLAADCP